MPDFSKKIKDNIHGEVSYNDAMEMTDHMDSCEECKKNPGRTFDSI